MANGIGYRDEKEFRLIYTDRHAKIDAKGIKIDLSCVKEVVLSPWIPEALADAVETTIRNAYENCQSIKVRRTTLLENERWKRAAEKQRSVLRGVRLSAA